MTKTQAQLIADFLDQLRTYQGCAGCNDYTLKDTRGNRTLVEEALKWNNPDNKERVYFQRGKIITYDHLICGYLRHLFMTEHGLEDKRNEPPL